MRAPAAAQRSVNALTLNERRQGRRPATASVAVRAQEKTTSQDRQRAPATRPAAWVFGLRVLRGLRDDEERHQAVQLLTTSRTPTRLTRGMEEPCGWRGCSRRFTDHPVSESARRPSPQSPPAPCHGPPGRSRAAPHRPNAPPPWRSPAPPGAPSRRRRRATWRPARWLGRRGRGAGRDPTRGERWAPKANRHHSSRRDARSRT